MIYPVGHAIHWRANIPPRPGAQVGTLSRPWHRYAAFPWVLWDDSTSERQELPECVEPVEEELRARVTAGKYAWDEYRAERTHR